MFHNFQGALVNGSRPSEGLVCTRDRVVWQAVSAHKALGVLALDIVCVSAYEQGTIQRGSAPTDANGC